MRRGGGIQKNWQNVEIFLRENWSFCLKIFDYLSFAAVESESAHHNISAAELHPITASEIQKPAETGLQAGKSLEEAVETEIVPSGIKFSH